MTCEATLEQLRSEFENWTCAEHTSCSKFERANISNALAQRQVFLARYPYVTNPDQISGLTAEMLYSPRSGDKYFLWWMIWGLRPLGGIGVRDMNPFGEALAHMDDIKAAMSMTLDSNNRLAERLDVPWDNIPGFGSEDRGVVKKILATYFPEQIVPIVNQGHLEHFVAYLDPRDERDRLSILRYNMEYHKLTSGQKFELLNQILLDCKSHHLDISSDGDNTYLMYYLYAGSARPPNMRQGWRPHTRLAGPRLPTGLDRVPPAPSRPPAVSEQVGPVVIKPETPYNNVRALRDLLRRCSGYVWWADLHFAKRALEELHSVILDHSDIAVVYILSGPANVNDSACREFHRFRDELQQRGIIAEWRVLEHFAHDRFIISRDLCMNVPPVNTIFTGGYSELNTAAARPPFAEWWSRAKPIPDS